MGFDMSRAVGSPTPVMIGEAQYLVSKLTARDMGDMQEFVKSKCPDPRLMARELCAGLPDIVALEVWRSLAEEAKDWPPELGSYKARDILNFTSDGIAYQVWVFLRKHNKQVDREEARRIAETITDEDMTTLMVAANPAPKFTPQLPGDGGPAITYEEVRAKLAEWYGWSFDTIDNMTMEQLDSAIRKGKPEAEGVPIEYADDFQKRWREYLGIIPWGDETVEIKGQTLADAIAELDGK
jgi:hypothetical protein